MTQPFSHADGLNALTSYGADFTRWPDQELAAYVQDEPALAEPIRQAADLDLQLSSAELPAPSDLLKNRILKAAQTTAQEHAPSTPAYGLNKLMRIAAIFLVSAFIGGAIWMNTSPARDAPVLSAEIDAETNAWRTAATDMDMIDIFLWVEDEEADA